MGAAGRRAALSGVERGGRPDGAHATALGAILSAGSNRRSNGSGEMACQPNRLGTGRARVRAFRVFRASIADKTANHATMSPASFFPEDHFMRLLSCGPAGQHLRPIRLMPTALAQPAPDIPRRAERMGAITLPRFIRLGHLPRSAIRQA
jgi:hypothetical protein